MRFLARTTGAAAAACTGRVLVGAPVATSGGLSLPNSSYLPRRAGVCGVVTLSGLVKAAVIAATFPVGTGGLRAWLPGCVVVEAKASGAPA